MRVPCHRSQVAPAEAPSCYRFIRPATVPWDYPRFLGVFLELLLAYLGILHRTVLDGPAKYGHDYETSAERRVNCYHVIFVRL